jgi:hypothetical protein
MDKVWSFVEPLLEPLLEYPLANDLATNLAVIHKRLANIFHPANLLSYLGIGTLFTVALLLLTKVVGSPATPFSVMDGESFINTDHVVLGWFLAGSLYLGIWSKRLDGEYTVFGKKKVKGNQDFWIYLFFTVVTWTLACSWEWIGNEPARLVFVLGWVLQVALGFTKELFHEQCEILVGPIFTNLAMILVSTITLSGLSTGLW